MKLIENVEEFKNSKYILNFYEDDEGRHIYILLNENGIVEFTPYGLESDGDELVIPFGTADYDVECYMHNYFDINNNSDMHYSLTEDEFLLTTLAETI